MTLYPASQLAALVQGSATSGVDLSPYISRCDATGAGATLVLTYHSELTGSAAPIAGQLVSIKQGTSVVLNAIVDRVRLRSSRGTRTLTVTCRTRDQLPVFRATPRLTQTYAAGSNLGVMTREIAEACGLTSAEYDLPDVGVVTAHDIVQLADKTAWEILQQALEPALFEPFVDAVGKLKSISRDVRRSPDLTLEDWMVDEVETGSGVLPITAMRVKWVDPRLSEVTQQERILSTVTLSAGFFKSYQKKNIPFSSDQKMRAKNTRMVIESSINATSVAPILAVLSFGLISEIASESYEQVAPEYGEITIELNSGLDAAAIAAVGTWAALELAWHTPEPVASVIAGGSTLPHIKAALVGAAEGVLWMCVFGMGQGTYKVLGVPWDMVHRVNEILAYDDAAEVHVEKVEELQNDLIPNDSVAQNLAVSELVYRARASMSAQLSMVDDLRIERGDILALADGRKFYVLEWQRDLSRGAQPLMTLGGFFV